METIHINISGRQTRPIAMHHTTAEWDELARYEPLTTVFHNNHTWLVINTIPETLVGSENMSPNTDIVNWCPFARHFFLTTQATMAGDITARINGVVTRIPIGTNGQILAVDDGTLQWIDVSLEGGRVLGAVVDSRGFANNRGQSDVAVEAFAFKNRKPYYESLLTGAYLWRDTDGRTGRINPNSYTIENDIHRRSGTGYVRRGFSLFSYRTPRGQGFETVFNATLLPPEIRAGLLTSSNNSATSTPLSNEGQIRNGRFYRTLNNDAFGGMLNFDQPRTTDDPWRGFVGTQVDNDSNHLDINPNDPNYYNESHVQEALSLTTTGTVGSALTLATNHNRATGEWDIFNSTTAPNDRGLEVIDWVETQDLFFIFLCKPVGDDDENNRTLWAMGGIELHARTSNRTTARLCWTNRANMRQTTGGGVGSRGLTTQGIYRAPQFTYRIRELTQISASGAYDALFNADDDFQYSNLFQIPADSLTTGGHFAVRMVDGSYQLHAPFHDNTQRDSTATALRSYPASVTNRDLFVFNGQDRSSYTATQNPWCGTSGATDGDEAIQIGANFEFWKTGDSTITGSLRLNDDATRTERNYTVGNNETIVQLKMITIWHIPYVNNFTTRTTTFTADRPANPPATSRWWLFRPTHLTMSYAGFADGSENRDITGTTTRLRSSRYPARLALIALTEEGNVWVAGEDSDRGALFSVNPVALNGGGDPIMMTQQTGDEFMNVDRIEYILNTQDDLEIRLGGGSDLSFDVETVNRLSLIRGNSIYVRETAFQATWQLASVLPGSIGTVDTDRNLSCALFYGTQDWNDTSTTPRLETSAMYIRGLETTGDHTYNFGRDDQTHTSWGNERVMCVVRTYEYTLDIGSIGRLFWINHHLYCINNHGTLLRSFVLDEPTITASELDGTGDEENTLFTWTHLTGMFNPVPSVSERTQLFGREL